MHVQYGESEKLLLTKRQNRDKLYPFITLFLAKIINTDGGNFNLYI